MSEWTARDDLLFAMQYVLARSKIIPKKDRGPDQAATVARQMLEHLELCGWRFEKEQPRKAGNLPIARPKDR